MKTAAIVLAESKVGAMMRAFAMVATMFALSGCLNWQGTYDTAAQRDCRQLLDADERRVCLSQVDQNSRERRAERRGG